MDRTWWVALLLLAPLAQAQVAVEDLTSPEEADAHIAGLGYPLPERPAERFADFTPRDDLATPGALEGALRVTRFVQITDMQLLDDDAPAPMRVGLLGGGDALFCATISCSAERPQEEYGDEIMQSVTEIVNAHHRLDPIGFAVHTGDNIDNALENEAMRYLDLLHGTATTTGRFSGFECEPDGQSEDLRDDSNDETTACTSLPAHMAGGYGGFDPDIDQRIAVGNHDILVQGNAAIEPGFEELANGFGRHFLHEGEFVGMHFEDDDPCGGGSVADHMGHGFALAGDRLCDDDIENDGYYAWIANGIQHIVLDTVNDDIFQHNENTGFIPSEGESGHDIASGLSEGALDLVQWQWLQGRLTDHADTATILYSHHTANSFYSDRFDPACGAPGCVNDALGEGGFLGRDQVLAGLDAHPNLVAWVGGHTHEHLVTPITGATNSFWNVETAGLLDLPQENRILEVWVAADGSQGFIAMDPFGHLFALGQTLAATDGQHDAEAAAGQPGDRRALLWFDIPDGVQVPIPGLQPGGVGWRPVALELVEPTGNLTPGRHTISIRTADADTDADIAATQVTLQVLAGPAGVDAPGEVIVMDSAGAIHATLLDVVAGDYTLLAAWRGDTEYAPVIQTFQLAVDDVGEEEREESPLGIPLLVLVAAALLARKR